jgi:hypothetical protein
MSTIGRTAATLLLTFVVSRISVPGSIRGTAANAGSRSVSGTCPCMTRPSRSIAATCDAPPINVTSWNLESLAP